MDIRTGFGPHSRRPGGRNRRLWKKNTTIDTGEQPGGGMMTIPEPGVPTAWTVYVRVDDINGACEKVDKNGGKVWKGPMEVPEVGWIAIVCDPQGACFGLWQPTEGK